jgi:BirA family biotin operon repressor/biotin-[acetyl-CoA-carboxylase] ligase
VPGRADAVVVGLGLNADWPSVPGSLVDVAAALNLVGHADVVDREALVADLLLALDRTWLPLLEDPDPAAVGRLLDVDRERSATLGRRVRVQLPAGELVGRAVELVASGALVVEADDGRRHEVTVGDVVHLRPAP